MGIQIPVWEGAILRGKGLPPIVKYRDTAVICAKTAEAIEMPFGLWAWIGARNHVLDNGPDPHGRGNFGKKEKVK